MNVTILTLNYYPELTGIGVYNYDFAEFLVGANHEVSVVCTFPYYPEWKRHPSYRGRLFDKDRIGAVSVVRCFTYIPKNLTSLKRVIHEGIFSLLAFFRILFSKKPDVLFSVSPPFLGIVAAAFLSKIRRIPLHIHIQDLQPDTAIDLGMLKGRFLIRMLYLMESISYRTASSISCIGQGMLERVRSKGIPDAKTLMFRNWINFDLSARIQGIDTSAVRQKLSLNNKYIVLHAGNMGKKQALDILLETAALAQEEHDDIVFLLLGDGAMRSELEQKAERENLRNVVFLGVQLKEEFLDILYAADLSVVLQRVQVRDIVVPSKLVNILAAGSPVIASVHAESETATVLRHLSTDVIVEPENPQALYQKILEFRNKDDSDMRKLRDEERQLAGRFFSKEQVLPPIMSHLERLAGGPGALELR